MTRRHSHPVGAAWALAGSGVVCLGAAAVLWLGSAGDGTAAVANATSFGRSDQAPAPAVSAPAVSAPAVSAPSAAPDDGTYAGDTGSDPVGSMAYAPAMGEPTRVTFPGVDAPVVPVGTAEDGSLEIPPDPATAGWWVAGAAPGETAGTVVVVGHLDSATQGVGAFAKLLAVQPGALVQLADEQGRSVSYRVVRREQVAKAQLPVSTFDRTSAPRLIIITCGGRFDPVTHYTDNILVVADPA